MVLSARADAAAPLERTAHGTDATPYLPGHAAAAIRAAANLSAASYGFPRTVRCVRAHPRPRACNRAWAAVNSLHRPGGDRGGALALRPPYRQQNSGVCETLTVILGVMSAS